MSGHSGQEPRARTLGSRCAYTRDVLSFAHRLTCFAIAMALSGSPVVLAACMALCLDSPVVTASASDGTQAGQKCHVAVAEPAAVSPHAHHGTASSTEPTVSLVSGSLPNPSAARVADICDSCCVGAFAAGPGLQRVDGRVFAPAMTVSVESFYGTAGTHAAAAPSPPIRPPSPARAPVALRI
jgi:hypothetical protein